MVVWVQNPFDNLPDEGYRKMRFWLMCEAFARAGHRVVFWTSDFSHATKAPRALKPDAFRSLDVRLVPTLPYPKNVCFKRIGSHRAYAHTWWKMATAPGVEKPDLIVSSIPSVSAAESALSLGRHFGAKVVVDVMDAWPETFERLVPRLLRPFAHLFLTPLRRRAQRLYREADRVTGVCARYRELTGRDDYLLAYHGIDCAASAAAKPRTADGVVRLVYAGNLGRTYDLETVVKAVEANDDFELDVAGFGTFSSAFARVRFHGYLPEGDLQQLLAAADVGVIPMAPDSWVGVPYKFCDYARTGLAIVSSLGGESTELLERHRCGVGYRVGDATSLARAVRQAVALERGASRRMCEALFDATKIYDDYVKRICND